MPFEASLAPAEPRTMSGASAFHARLRALPPAMLRSLRRGIEKESLRVEPDGTLALTPHPRELGSALTHPHITTDFSESLIELITGVHTGIESCLEELERIHQFVYRRIGRELLWGASMPCCLPDENTIPIARYGSSNVARAKTVYRVGLSHRYGKRMQMIAGLHYNWSLPEGAWALPGFGDASAGYFGLIRNFRRNAWLLMYLFGASPAVCATFVEGRQHGLQPLGPGTMGLPNATSLRMGRLGYLSDAQEKLSVSYNSLASYTASLYDAMTQPYPAYERIGIRDGRVAGDGVDSYRQLATSLLQIENEFYSTIRPKRVIDPGERPLHALRERGVEYIEVRAMDLDPFAPVGIRAETIRFLDVFLLHCLASESAPDTPAEIESIGRNKQRVAARGREPGLLLDRGGETIELRAWGGEVLRECEPVADALDRAHGGSAHRDALAAAFAGLDNPETLPSARVLAEMAERHEREYPPFALARSVEHRRRLMEKPLPREVEAEYDRAAKESIEEQARIEKGDKVTFEEYRRRYLEHEKLKA
jgi:glutamate--cysteine ligase